MDTATENMLSSVRKEILAALNTFLSHLLYTMTLMASMIEINGVEINGVGVIDF